MAEVKNFPNNADEYIGAENVMKWLHGRTSGVFAAGNNLAVTSQGGMDIAVSDGVGWIANSESDGTVFWNDDFKTTGTQLGLSLELADAYNPRIDRVVVSWDTVDYVARPSIEILKGAASSAPAAPALTRTANKWQISLAQIYVGTAVDGVTAANITDERLNASVCGLVTAALEIDSSMANSQFLATLAQLQAQASQTITETQNQAESLLDAIQTELDGLNAGTEVMLKSVYDKDGDGVVDDAAEAQATANSALTKAEAAQTTANAASTAAAAADTKASNAQTTAAAALPKSGGAMTGTLSNANAAQVRNIQAGTDDLTAGTSSLTTGTVYLVYE